jgi:hypothetical protein
MSYCYHSRAGLGETCHAALERDWDTPEGRALAVRWGELMGVWERMRRLRGGG